MYCCKSLLNAWLMSYDLFGWKLLIDFSNEDPLVNLGIKSRLVFAFGILISLPLDMLNELVVIDGRR